MGATGKSAAAAPTRIPRKRRIGTSRTGSPRSTGAAFEILQSKLEIPSLRPGLVRRTALVNRLRRSHDARVFAIAAPPGYGKSTLLAQWAHAEGRPFAWVSLDARDDDPVSFLMYVAAALDSVHPIDPAVFRAVAAGGDAVWTTGVPRLGAALASIPEPILLVLDDVHELKHRDCVSLLEPLAKHLRGGSQLVLCGHADPGVPLARIRADRRLVEIGPADLALSDREARTLLRGVGVTVSEEEAHALNCHAEGWMAGLHLAALVMQQSDDPDAVASFDGSDRFVVDYLRGEHLSRLKKVDVEFLTRTSILDRMTGPLCDELLGRTDSARRLQALEERNSFVVALDHHRQWYRYHHLFREMLRSELERLEPDVAVGLHRSAASWYERNGFAGAAIEQAAAAGDLDTLARLIGEQSMPFYRSGRVATVERWFRWFDEPELLAHYPSVAAMGALIHALRGRPDDAARFAYAVEHSEVECSMPDGSTSVRPWAAFLRSLFCDRGVAEMRGDAALALEGLGRTSFFRPGVGVLLGVATLLDGEPERAEAILVETTEDAVRSGDNYSGVAGHAQLALLALGRGELAEAQMHLAHGDDLLDNQPIEEYMPAGIHVAASARVALQAGQAATSRELLVDAMRLRPQLSYAIPWFAVQTMLELARCHVALADVDGARTLLREAQDVIQHRPDLGILPKQVNELSASLSHTIGLDHGWASTLTAAELRLLPFLTTHLSFREIAERLYVSRNTVKSQAISVYRKLDASSRSEAIQRAMQLGLVDIPGPSGSGFTPSG